MARNHNNNYNLNNILQDRVLLKELHLHQNMDLQEMKYYHHQNWEDLTLEKALSVNFKKNYKI